MPDVFLIVAHTVNDPAVASPEQAVSAGFRLMNAGTKAYQDAGAIGVEIEIVPDELAAEIDRRLENLILISMGSGKATVQYLFATDVLGTNTGHVPRHAKVYGQIGKEEARVQKLRTEAFRALHEEVQSGAYPAAGHVLKMKDDELTAFLAGLPEPRA